MDSVLPFEFLMKSILQTFRFAAGPLAAVAVGTGCGTTASESTGDSGMAALQEVLLEASEAAEKGQYERATERYSAALAEANSSGAGAFARVRILQALARLKAVQGLIDPADSLHLEALALLEGDSDDLDASSEELVQALGSLGNLALARGDLDTAEWRFRQILQRGAEGEISLQRHDIALALTVSGLAKVAQARGDLERADSLSSRGMGLKLYSQGFAAYTHNDLQQAESMYRRALSVQEKSLGPFHPDLAATSTALGRLLAFRGLHPSAIPFFERAARIYESVPDAGYEFGASLEALSKSLAAASRNAEADSVARLGAEAMAGSGYTGYK